MSPEAFIIFIFLYVSVSITDKPILVEEPIVFTTVNLLLDIFRTESPSFQEVERFSIERIYGHRSVVEIENAGYNVMYELLNHFIPPIIKEKSERKGFEKKALQLIPSQFIYEEGTVYEKVLGVLDFVSGMTDNFATDLYRKIKGIYREDKKRKKI